MTGDWLTQDFDEIIITTNGNYSLTLADISPFGVGGPYRIDTGFTVDGINMNGTNDYGYVHVEITNQEILSTDTNAPAPDPSLWSVLPATVSDSKIDMTASNSTDAIYGVEYMFTNTTLGYSSGWISTNYWADCGDNTGVITNAADLISDPQYAALDSNWEGFEAGPGAATPSTFVSVLAGTATVTPATTNEMNFYQSFGAGPAGNAALNIGQAYTFSVESDNSSLNGGAGAVAFVKAFTAGWAFIGAEYQTVALPLDGSPATINFTPAGGAFYQVGTWTTNATTGSYEVTNPMLLTTNVTGTLIPLDPLTTYDYQVRARDTSPNLNETGWSTEESAMTAAGDSNAPSPATMSFASTDASPVSVLLTATTATDVSGVEYYFTCTAGPGNDSGWQSSPVYHDSGLPFDTNLSYTVIARDLSALKNSNTVSTAVNVSTLAEPASGSYSNSLTAFPVGDSDDGAVQIEVEKAGLTTGSINALATIDYDGSGATFGDGVDFQGRNLLRTIADDYEDVSFEAYCTITLSLEADLSAYIGLGSGIQTGLAGSNWGVPELAVNGAHGIFGEFKDSTAGGAAECKIIKVFDGNAISNTVPTVTVANNQTIRARFIYDSVSNTVSVAADLAYAGGPFVNDLDLGTMDTLTNGVSIFDGAPCRVYVGGGEGTIVKDFEVNVTGVPLTTFPLEIVVLASGDKEISWVGAAGQSYEVQYTTDLTSGFWLKDTSVIPNPVADTGGSQSVTSTVPVAEAFYRFLLD